MGATRRGGRKERGPIGDRSYHVGSWVKNECVVVMIGEHEEAVERRSLHLHVLFVDVGWVIKSNGSNNDT